MHTPVGSRLTPTKASGAARQAGDACDRAVPPSIARMLQNILTPNAERGENHYLPGLPSSLAPAPPLPTQPPLSSGLRGSCSPSRDPTPLPYCLQSSLRGRMCFILWLPLCG